MYVSVHKSLHMCINIPSHICTNVHATIFTYTHMYVYLAIFVDSPSAIIKHIRRKPAPAHEIKIPKKICQYEGRGGGGKQLANQM